MNNLRIILTIICIQLMACTNKKPEIYKLNYDDDKEGYLNHYYVIDNPPKDKSELIKLVEAYNVAILHTYSEQIQEASVFNQIFYEEGWTVDRHSPPNYTGRGLLGIRIFGKQYYEEVRLVSAHHYGGRYFHKREDEPISPYYRFGGKDGLYYYPNGFRNAPGKHWEKMKD